MFEDKFGLDDDSYWLDPWASRKEIQAPLMQEGREGFLIGAPRVAALDRRKTLPVAVLRVRKAQGGSPVDFRASAVIAAWDNALGRLNARLAFPKPPASPLPRKPASAGKGDSFSGDDSAMISEASTLDLAARLQLPLAGGEHFVSLICLNESSNRCRTKRVDSAAFHDPEAEDYVRALREEGMGAPRIHPEPGQASASYVRQEKSPDIPEDAGIALAAQRVTLIRAGRSCLLHGSYRLPAQPGPATGLQCEGSDVTAVLPMGLLITGSVDPAPIVLNLRVPCISPLVKRGGQAFATGFFTLDLCALAPVARVVQTCFLYAFSGEAMAGPALAAFVNPVLTWKNREELARETATQAG